MLAKGANEGRMSFGTHFFPGLAHTGDYFGAMKNMMECVEENKHIEDEAAQGRVCANEFKALRMAAFDNQLLYSRINQQHFMYQNTINKGELPH